MTGYTEPLGIVRGLVLPRQFLEGRLVASCPVAILRNVEFLVLVVFHAGTVLIAPAVTLSINAARFHKDRIPSNALACHNLSNRSFKRCSVGAGGTTRHDVRNSLKAI
jgi:hypothetical protein